jgi:hypothetical protein
MLGVVVASPVIVHRRLPHELWFPIHFSVYAGIIRAYPHQRVRRAPCPRTPPDPRPNCRSRPSRRQRPRFPREAGLTTDHG